MKALLTYELHKFLSSKKNIVIICIFLLFLSIFIYINFQKDQAYPETMQNEMQEYAQKAANNSKAANTATMYTKDEHEKKKLREEADFWSKLAGACILLQADYMTNSYQNIAFLRNEEAFYSIILKGYNKGYNIESVIKTNKKTIKENIQINQYCIENHILPDHSPYACNFFNLINLIFSGYYPLLLLLLFLLLIFDISSSEFENGTYKILYTSSYSRNKILFSKFLFSILLSLFFILALLLVFLISGLFFGLGTATYPFVIYSSIKTKITADMYMLLIFFSSILFLIAMIQTITYTTFSSSTTLATTILIYAIIIIYEQVFDFQTAYKYLPVCYIHIKEIIQNHGIWISFFISCISTIVLMQYTRKTFSKSKLNIDIF